jgi:hypothetical protein
MLSYLLSEKLCRAKAVTRSGVPSVPQEKVFFHGNLLLSFQAFSGPFLPDFPGVPSPGFPLRMGQEKRSG